jgi:Ca2+/Na+ antiporter
LLSGRRRIQENEKAEKEEKEEEKNKRRRRRRRLYTHQPRLWGQTFSKSGVKGKKKGFFFFFFFFVYCFDSVKKEREKEKDREKSHVTGSWWFFSAVRPASRCLLLSLHNTSEQPTRQQPYTHTEDKEQEQQQMFSFFLLLIWLPSYPSTLLYVPRQLDVYKSLLPCILYIHIYTL